MSPVAFLVFALLHPLPHSYATTEIECVRPNHPQTRTFPTLIDYQHNSQSFQVNGAGYAGNYIDFNFSSIDAIPKNAFITFSSQYIWQITLSGKHIKRIDDGAFLNLDCLHVLNLAGNNLSVVSEGMWRGLRALTTLNLEGNLIVVLGNLVFRELGELRHLNLADNRLKQIQLEAFHELYRLETLDLSGNLLSELHPEVFVSLVSLISLQLNSNRLRELEPQRWSSLTKLTELNLADNSLTSFDPTYNFSFTTLTTLNLSMNALTKLNVHALRLHLPLLTTIDISRNPWHCEDLAVIIPALRDSRIVYKSTKNNPYGISCNYNTAVYTEKPTTTTTKTSTTTDNSTNPLLVQHLQNATLQIRTELQKSNQEILNSMQKTRNLIVALIVLVVIFIGLELTFRTGLLDGVIRRRRRDGHYLHDDNVDNNIALLTT